MKEDEWAHIDIGNQIDNSWNKDTALALKLNKVTFSIKIRETDKKEIEKKYIKQANSRKDFKEKRKVIVLLYSFLLFKLLNESNGICKKVKVCNDVSPANDVYRYLNKICKYYNVKPLEQRMKIRFKKKGDGESKAHGVANRVFKGRKPADYLIKSKDIEDFNNIVREILHLG